MKSPHDIIIRPVLTEKSYDHFADKTYTFVVDKRKGIFPAWCR